MTTAWNEDWHVDKERADQYALLTGVEPGERPGQYIGTNVDDGDHTMCGGAVVGQAITAITRDAPEGRRLHLTLNGPRPCSISAAGSRGQRRLDHLGWCTTGRYSAVVHQPK